MAARLWGHGNPGQGVEVLTVAASNPPPHRHVSFSGCSPALGCSFAASGLMPTPTVTLMATATPTATATNTTPRASVNAQGEMRPHESPPRAPLSTRQSGIDRRGKAGWRGGFPGFPNPVRASQRKGRWSSEQEREGTDVLGWKLTTAAQLAGQTGFTTPGTPW